MARRCGLLVGTSVVAGCGDTAASFLACGATREGICVDVAGTASVFAATTRTFRPDTAHRVLSWGRSAVPGLWHPYAYINGGGMNLEWFRREIANCWMSCSIHSKYDCSAFGCLSSMANGWPISSGTLSPELSTLTAIGMGCVAVLERIFTQA